MPLSVVTAPAVEPVSLTEAKRHLRITSSDDDLLLTPQLIAAREDIESRWGRVLITRTLKYTLPGFPCATFPQRPTIALPSPPLQTVDQIVYLDGSGNQQTLDPSVYVVTLGNPGRVTLATGQSWPATLDHPEAVSITYTAGYGDDADDIPQRIRQAILLQLNQLFDGPDDKCERAIQSILTRGRNLTIYDHTN